ncbi:MAG: AAA family ATPase [Rhodobacteraceae bacterium]|nr:AAA family ATPase [Paracoccaceae bacterium]
MAATLMNLSQFLQQIDLSHLHEKLTSEDIDLTVLPLLDDADLKELGLSLGQRKKLLRGLKALDDTAGSKRHKDVKTANPVQLRRLSVLFCDMVGSTELGERLDIDDMQVVLQHYYDIASSVAQKHNGHLAGSQGDGVVMLFGYPKVIEGFAERSVVAARDLQQRLAEQPVLIDGRDPIHIVTRIGIASGQAAVGFKDGEGSGDQIHLVGPVVNRAARLQTVANPQSCAVDAKTHDLTQASVTYATAQRHPLKGLSDPVEVYHLIGLRRSQYVPAVPSEFVGRDSELETLSDLWSRTNSGAFITLTVSGDAGVGKSALVQRFLASCEPPVTRVTHLHCNAMAAQSPLRPVADALAGLIQSSDEKHALFNELNAPSQDLAVLAGQFLHLTDDAAESAAFSAGDRDSILDLLCLWLMGSAETPGIVVLENAQWLDDTTRALMSQTAEAARVTGKPIFMIAVTRDTALDVWKDSETHQQLALQPLDETDAKSLMDRILAGAPVPEAIRENILYHADGNPLVLGALLQSQSRSSFSNVPDAVVVPHTIYETVSKRLDSIQSGRGLIEALAVFGAPTPLNVLNEAFPLDEDTRDATLGALETAGLIERRKVNAADVLSIRHKAYRDVIYEQIDGPVRRKLHAAAFRALQDLVHERPEILAKHAQAAQDWNNTLDHALTAGETFLKRSALIEAGHFLEMAEVASKRLPANTQVTGKRLRTITGLASVERSRFGIATDRSAELGQQTADLAHAIGDRHAELMALYGLYSHALVRADYIKAEQQAKLLLDAAELSQNKTFMKIAYRAIGAVALHRGDQITAQKWLENALEQYDRDTDLPIAHAHGYDHAEITSALLAMSLWISGDLQRAWQMGAFSIDHSREIDHAHSLAQAVSFRVMWGAMARHGSALSGVAAEGQAIAEKHGISVMRAAARLFPFATNLCLQRSAPSAAELVELDKRVTEFRAANPFNYGALLASVLAEIYVRAGDLDKADAVLLGGAETTAKTGETWTSSELLRMQARVASARKNEATATRLRKEALDNAIHTQANSIALRVMCDMAEIDPHPENIHAVQEALSRMSSLDDGWDVRRARALLGTGSGV